LARGRPPVTGRQAAGGEQSDEIVVVRRRAVLADKRESVGRARRAVPQAAGHVKRLERLGFLVTVTPPEGNYSSGSRIRYRYLEVLWPASNADSRTFAQR